MSRILLIDGSNIYMAAKSIGLRIDYKRLYDLYAEDGELLRAYYFTALPNRSVESPNVKLADWLSYNRYIVIDKEYSEYYDADGIKKIKGNMDIEIAVYALGCARLATELVLFSGDGDFTILVKTIQEQNACKVNVVSSKSLINYKLRKQADNFTDLALLVDDIKQER